MRRVFWGLVLASIVAVLFGALPGAVVFPALLGLAVWSVGVATLGSLRRGAAHVPDGPPEPVDVRAERTTYWCSGCGAEVLLLVRGAPVPPRHCGERMVERREVARDVLS